MRVNSHFRSFLNSRTPVGFGMIIVMLTIFFSASSFTERSDPGLRAKQVNLIIRQIGHRLLLQAGDSTSSVLPVTETKEGTFLLSFENEIIFSHDSLMALSQGLLPKAEFSSGYTVTVHDCMTASIVYGFQFNSTSPDLLPCRGRSQPPGCYTIEFAFPDFYENIEQEKADIDQPTQDPKSVNVDQEAKPLKEFKTRTANIDQLTKELKLVKVDPQEVNPKPEAVKTTAPDHPLVNLVYSGGMLVLLGVTLLIGRFWKYATPVPVQHQNQAIIKKPNPEFAPLGKFLLDAKGQRLLLGSEEISLTDKECKILELLNNNFSELIPRETLMQKVWINEGVITSRSLDMFVSKLRKKLSQDPELRITNVHGKGYKLEIPGIQNL